MERYMGVTPGVGEQLPGAAKPELSGPVQGPNPPDAAASAANAGLAEGLIHDVSAQGPSETFEELAKGAVAAEPGKAPWETKPAIPKPEASPPEPSASVIEPPASSPAATAGEKIQPLTIQEQAELKRLQGLAIRTVPEQARFDALSRRATETAAKAPAETGTKVGAEPKTEAPPQSAGPEAPKAEATSVNQVPRTESPTPPETTERLAGYYEAKAVRELARAMTNGATPREVAMHEQRIKAAILKDAIIRTGAAKRAFDESEGSAPSGRLSRLWHRISGKGERSEAASQADQDYAEALKNDGRSVEARFAEAKKVKSEAQNELNLAKKTGKKDQIDAAQERYNLVNEYFLLVRKENRRNLKKELLKLLAALGFTAVTEVSGEVRGGYRQGTQQQRGNA